MYLLSNLFSFSMLVAMLLGALSYAIPEYTGVALPPFPTGSLGYCTSFFCSH